MRNMSPIELAGALALATLIFMPPSLASDPNPPDQPGKTPVIYLGPVPIVGEGNIYRTLQSIKVALARPYSTRNADANLVVCRINRSMSQALHYLDCDTNRNYTQRRERTQLAFMSAQGRAGKPVSQGEMDPLAQTMSDDVVTLENIVSDMPEHRLHIPINPAALRELLDQIPMPAPAAATSAPAAGP